MDIPKAEEYPYPLNGPVRSDAIISEKGRYQPETPLPPLQPQSHPMPYDQVFSIGGRALILFLCIVSSIQYFTAENPWTVIDGADLLFHEAGHLLFSFLGEFVSFAGGTGLQLLVPVIVGGYFFYKRAWFSLLFVVFWFGINLVNIGVYIKDATAMALPLVGGGIHDWNYLLSHLGLLSSDQLIGGIVRGTGLLFILTTEVCMGIYLLWLLKNRKNIPQPENS